MFFDYKATEKGEFLLEISDYETGQILGTVHLVDLKPFHRLSRGIIIGER